jgi:hypothetical protein
MKRGFIMSKAERIRELEYEIKTLKEELKEAKKIINGEKHNVGAQCTGCANLVLVEEKYLFNTFTEQHCKLDFKCKDRVEISGKVLCEDEKL